MPLSTAGEYQSWRIIAQAVDEQRHAQDAARRRSLMPARRDGHRRARADERAATVAAFDPTFAVQFVHRAAAPSGRLRPTTRAQLVLAHERLTGLWAA
jgi:hypothetical protein